MTCIPLNCHLRYYRSKHQIYQIDHCRRHKNDIVDGSVTYQEWYNSLSDEQKTALKLSKRKDSNKTSDKLQHAKYVKVLGTKEVPRSFDKWIDIRYNDSEKYSELKSKYRNAIVSQSRLTNLFSQYNNGQKDLIVFRNIEKELNRSNVGKECIDYLINNPCTVNLYYNIDVRKSLLGEYISGYDEINIYASNTKTVKTTAETIIHEATHRRYNIYGDKHAEAVCIAQEYKHHYNVDKLSFAQKREVIKEVNRNYQSYKWRERHT